MIRAGNALGCIGLTAFILGACAIDSAGIWQYVAGCVAISGMLLIYIGYRKENRVRKRGSSNGRKRVIQKGGKGDHSKVG